MPSQQEIERIVGEFLKIPYHETSRQVDWLRTTLAPLTEAHKVEKEELVKEIMDLFYCMNFDITIAEQHQLDIEIKAIAKKFNIEVK